MYTYEEDFSSFQYMLHDMVWNSKYLLDWPSFFEQNFDRDSHLESLRDRLPEL